MTSRGRWAVSPGAGLVPAGLASRRVTDALFAQREDSVEVEAAGAWATYAGEAARMSLGMVEGVDCEQGGGLCVRDPLH